MTHNKNGGGLTVKVCLYTDLVRKRRTINPVTVA